MEKQINLFEIIGQLTVENTQLRGLVKDLSEQIEEISKSESKSKVKAVK